MSGEFSCILNAWRAHEPELRGYLIHRMSDPHAAEDLLQEVFVKAMRQGKDFCSLANARAWLFQVARNALVDHQRLHKETIEVSEELPAPEAPAEPLVALSACVARVLTELSPEDRDIIEQCDLNGAKQSDYAKSHGLSLAATKSRLLRARARMGETLSTNCKVEFDPEGRVVGHVPRK
ncbi:sigma-70 family RNA polymerase sigma factor [Ferrigenium sp. UT5]|uniref:sigma-70 family RNA polymerase sigma factor n=1 Tax=Ferrigenium sp. UT5 TaxID=3242105 RepID=UPI00354EA131